ncbi:MAG TPA: DUF2855 family protein [Actinomycetota bacterium]|nr:DUF2855 family protein [Actinomycetota bacterium]
MTGIDFLVRRDDLRDTRFQGSTGATTELSPGQILLAIDKFGFSANNVTYALMGGSMGYWDFFPGPEGWGRVPVWGYADVIRSEREDIKEGERVFSYLPMSSHLLASPIEVSGSGFLRAPKLEHLSSVYQRTLRVAADPRYSREREDLDALWRPLFMTSFGLADHLVDEKHFSAESVVFSSASSKTALGTAFLLSKSEPPPGELVALTSPANVEFCERLGYYDRVVRYDELRSLSTQTSTVFVDVGGSVRIRRELRDHLGGGLKHVVIVGAAQWEDVDAAGGLGDPDSELFFLPSWMAKRRGDWGKGGFAERYGHAWTDFAPSVAEWMNIEQANGADAVERVYRELIGGKTSPEKGHILSLTRN